MIVALDARLLASTNTGDTSYWRGLVSGLLRTDADARFLLMSNAAPATDVPVDERFEWLRFGSSGGRRWSWLDFPREAKRRGAQAIHTQYALSPLVGDRGVTTVHDVSFYVGPQWFKPKDRWLMRASMPGTAKRASKILTVSETSRAEIEHFLPASRGKVVVTPNALGQNIQPIDAKDAHRICAKLGLGGPFLLTVGTSWPRKNMRLAIEAVDRLPEHVPHKLAITGKFGWGELPNCDRIVQTGYVDDRTLSALYRSADLYLAPSKHEGFGIPVLEAWASECPVFASTGGALPEVVGDAGFVQEGWSPEAWSEGIVRALGDSSNLAEMRKRGLRRLERFDWKRTAELTLEVYSEVAE